MQYRTSLSLAIKPDDDGPGWLRSTKIPPLLTIVPGPFAVLVLRGYSTHEHEAQWGLAP